MTGNRICFFSLCITSQSAQGQLYNSHYNQTHLPPPPHKSIQNDGIINLSRASPTDLYYFTRYHHSTVKWEVTTGRKSWNRPSVKYFGKCAGSCLSDSSASYTGSRYSVERALTQVKPTHTDFALRSRLWQEAGQHVKGSTRSATKKYGYSPRHGIITLFS
jgi:hypothetical protein